MCDCVCACRHTHTHVPKRVTPCKELYNKLYIEFLFVSAFFHVGLSGAAPPCVQIVPHNGELKRPSSRAIEG
jgi:hypothetical protein